jgi:hypothetical protein
MDSRRFDTLTRTITNSRRGTIRSLLLGTVGVFAACQRAPNVAADCKRVGQNCDRNSDCCTGATCKNGKCRCKSGRTECSGKCFDFDNDEEHCGDCTTPCAAGESCCSGQCVDLQSSRDNCSACGVSCAADEICFEGACLPCPVGNQVCGEICCAPFLNCCGGACVSDLTSNPDHCGECGNRCPGICSQNDSGREVCHGPRCCTRGECVDDVQSNRDNCGACGHECASDENCCDGQCGSTCGNHYCACDETCCDDECADLRWDHDHCGRCGNNCGLMVCQEGRCRREVQ